MTFIKHIIRYPIKGLNGNFVDKIRLLANETIEGDKQFTFNLLEVVETENTCVAWNNLVKLQLALNAAFTKFNKTNDLSMENIFQTE